VIKKVFIGSLQPDETVDAAQEARLLQSLDHPNIVKFYDSFVEKEFFCIVTEFCDVSILN
jgi:NIMA (never in mitosis gene a)-related kinase 11